MAIQRWTWTDEDGPARLLGEIRGPAPEGHPQAPFGAHRLGEVLKRLEVA